MRLSPIVENFRLYSAEVLGNPLLRPKVLEEMLESRPVGVKPVDQWPCARVPYEVEDQLSAERRLSRAHLERQESKHVSLMENLDDRLLREARKPPQESSTQGDPTLAYERPRNFDAFLALIEAAFGQGQGLGAREGRGFRPAATGANSPLTHSLDPSPPRAGERAGLRRKYRAHGGAGSPALRQYPTPSL
jgi:hypothetical protein